MNAFERIDVPGEHDARERAWQVARAAFAEREPAPRPRRRAAPALALGLAAVVAAVAFTPPGRAVVETVRKAIGIEPADEALFSLPALGRLLVVSDGGAWAVAEDGSQRRLGDYDEVGCSPFGRFVVAARPSELAALEPDGDVRWKLSRPGIRAPVWGGTLNDTRIAYVSRGVVRVVAGNGIGDRALTAGRAAAWSPGSVRLLAVATASRVSLFDVERSRMLWSARLSARSVAWSADGTRILALGAGGYAVLATSGRVLDRDEALTASFAPRGHGLAVVRRVEAGAELRVGGRLRFQGTGTFADVRWSPDGRWLALSWPDADQLLFVRASSRRTIRAAANVARQFESASFPSIAAWCPLPPS